MLRLQFPLQHQTSFQVLLPLQILIMVLMVISNLLLKAISFLHVLEITLIVSMICGLLSIFSLMSSGHD
jgi:hypothetical protein